MLLPKLPARIRRNRQEIMALRGVNYTDSYNDGDLAQSRNLSTRRWPYLSARWGRRHVEEYDGATALTAWEELVVVKAGHLYYGGQDVGEVTPGEKQFAVLNTKLVIWPDKKYLDLQSKTIHNMGASVSALNGVFTTNTLTLTGVSGKFKAGDTVNIKGSSITGNNKDVYIKAVSGNRLTVEDHTFTAGTSQTAVTVTRRIPDMDYICESENRLWGCSNETRTIYASALGDPTNFYNYQGLSTDSYAVSVGSEGDFTGCCRISSAVLFWKERTLHKILGSYPAEYAQYTYSVEGLKAGCHKSLQVVNEVLYYMGEAGVHAYSGGTPSRISPGFDGRDFGDAVAGTDGERYYLSVAEGPGVHHLFTYDLNRSIWLREDETDCVDFARLGNALYFLTSEGEVWQTQGGDDQQVSWEAQFTPFYETILGRKRYTRLTLRLELPRGSWLRAQLRGKNGVWETVAQWTTAGAGSEKTDALTAVLPIRRGDKLELRLEGKGPFTVLDVMREFTVESMR